MGCFLTITPQDFARLNSSLKASLSIVESRVGEMKIEVQSTALHTAREMAKLIRNQASSAQVTTGTTQDSKWSVATVERFQHVAATLFETCPPAVAVLFNGVQNQFKATMIRTGKIEAEPIAANILVQSGYLDGGQKFAVTRARGVDIQGRTITNTQVMVEVKFSTQDKDFGKMMNKGVYKDDVHPEGYRQMSDGWLGKVSGEFNPSQTNILGVHINPLKETVTIYRRMDADATKWKALVTKPLSEFDL